MSDSTVCEPGASARVDAHTHVFLRDLSMAPGRRYTPGYDATLPDLFTHLDDHGLDRAVLVQPSFLGTDNSYMLAAIAQAPDRLRGVAMVDPEVTDETMSSLAAHGVVGVRFNLVGLGMPPLNSTPWQSLLRRIAAIGWHVELHRESRDLRRLVDSVLAAGCLVVVDHYGRPDPELGLSDGSLKQLVDYGSSQQVWVKLSAPYRCAPSGQAFEREAASAFVEAFGPDRLLWGSDWPHTQFEGAADVSASLAALKTALPDTTALEALLGGTANKFYGFPMATA